MPRPNSADSIDARVSGLLSELTLREKISLLSGGDFWHTRAVERLGIPAIRMTDGPHGVTVSGDQSGPATCFPTAVGMAATWNRKLIERVGTVLGREARARGNQVLLGPSVDLHRSPLNGRNYESYSEDPYLAGRLAAAYVRGVQSQGVGACIKHCTANNQQTEQSRTSSEVTERPLRELYLKPWQLALREAEPWAIMTSYNLLNGEYTSANRHLLTDLLKGELCFGGFVVSDWRGVHGREAAVAGLDLEMPGPGKHLTEERLAPLLASGELTEADIDDKARRLLTAVLKATAPVPSGADPAGGLDTPWHRALAREVAAESMVLLKNDGGLLPLDTGSIKTLAVIGPNACEARLGGGGSSSTTPFYAVGPMEGLLERCGDQVDIIYAEGCSFRGEMPAVQAAHLGASDGARPGLSASYFDNPDLSGDPVLQRLDAQVDFSWGWSSPGGQTPKDGYSARWTGQLTAPTSGTHRLGLTWEDGGVRLYLDEELLIDEWPGGREGDGQPNFEARYARRSRAVDVEMTGGERRPLRLEYAKVGNRAALRLEWREPGAEDPIDRARKTAAAADVAIVFAGLSNLYEGGNNDRKDIALPAGQDQLISAVVEANPQTIVVLVNGSPVAMDPWLGDVPAIVEAWYPGQEGGHAIAAALFGDTNPSGRLPDTFPSRLEDNPSFGNYPGEGGEVHYEEGVYVGYRHYDRSGVEPLFPFGHGLSYTRFEYADLTVSPGEVTEDGEVSVSVNVTNCGTREGMEVVQVYAAAPEGDEPRPHRELVGFDKTQLEPGQTRKVTVAVRVADLAWYDETKGWVVEPGDYEVAVPGCLAPGRFSVSARDGSATPR